MFKAILCYVLIFTMVSAQAKIPIGESNINYTESVSQLVAKQIGQKIKLVLEDYNKKRDNPNAYTQDIYNYYKGHGVDEKTLSSIKSMVSRVKRLPKLSFEKGRIVSRFKNFKIEHSLVEKKQIFINGKSFRFSTAKNIKFDLTRLHNFLEANFSKKVGMFDDLFMSQAIAAIPLAIYALVVMATIIGSWAISLIISGDEEAKPQINYSKLKKEIEKGLQPTCDKARENAALVTSPHRSGQVINKIGGAPSLGWSPESLAMFQDFGGVGFEAESMAYLLKKIDIDFSDCDSVASSVLKLDDDEYDEFCGSEGVYTKYLSCVEEFSSHVTSIDIIHDWGGGMGVSKRPYGVNQNGHLTTDNDSWVFEE